jgi:hypothetical protein
LSFEAVGPASSCASEGRIDEQSRQCCSKSIGGDDAETGRNELSKNLGRSAR